MEKTHRGPGTGREDGGGAGRGGGFAAVFRVLTALCPSHSRFGPRTDLHVPRALLEKETETQHPGGPQTPALRVQDRWVELHPVPGVAPSVSLAHADKRVMTPVWIRAFAFISLRASVCRCVSGCSSDLLQFSLSDWALHLDWIFSYLGPGVSGAQSGIC